MTDLTQKELVVEIARDVVTQIAPQELPIFQAVSDTYFADPGNTLKSLKSEDRMLGFGLDPTAILLTPVILHVMSEIFQFLTPIAKKAVEDGLGNEISQIIKRMFSRFHSSKPPVLNNDQIKLIHKNVLMAAKNLRLSDDKAALLANAVAGQFLVDDQ